MTVTDDMSDSYNSTGSQSLEEENLVIFCKQMLKTRVFQGSYQERRYVEHLKGYRDLVVVDNSETELKGDLKYTRHRVSSFYQNPDIWLGITLADMVGVPAGTCIWTDIDDTPFGRYWFQIKSIRFRREEIYIKLKPLRLVNADATSAGSSTNRSENDSGIMNDGLTADNVLNLLRSWKQAISANVMSFLSNDVNRENIVAALRFFFLLVLSVLTGTLELIKFLGVFSIRLFAETRLLLKTATPIILKIIDLFSKVIGGFYILLAMIWRDVFGGKNRTGSPQRLVEPGAGYRAIDNRPFYDNRKRF